MELALVGQYNEAQPEFGKDSALILLTLPPFVKFTPLGPQAIDGHGRWILVARLVGYQQQLHASCMEGRIAPSQVLSS